MLHFVTNIYVLFWINAVVSVLAIVAAVVVFGYTPS